MRALLRRSPWMMNDEWTILTYNCAHVRSTKESLTFQYDRWWYLVSRGQYWLELGGTGSEQGSTGCQCNMLSENIWFTWCTSSNYSILEVWNCVRGRVKTGMETPSSPQQIAAAPEGSLFIKSAFLFKRLFWQAVTQIQKMKDLHQGQARRQQDL